jgi:tetratricopeptide (TPR) repeat protein
MTMAILRILIILMMGVPSILWIKNRQARLWADCANTQTERNSSACATIASGWFTAPRGRGSAHFNIAINHQNARNYEAAITAYTLSIEQAIASNDERIAENYYGRAWNYDALKRHEDAVEDYTKAIEINPNYHAAYFNRAIQYSKLEKYSLAEADNRAALRIKPDNADTHYNLGSMLDAQDRQDEAMASFTRAIELAPKDPDGYNRRGKLYYAGASRDLDKALADFDHAVALGKRDALLFWYRASVRSQRDDYKGAIADLNQSIAIDPNNQRSYYDRANANRALGNTSAAERDMAAANALPGAWRSGDEPTTWEQVVRKYK